MIKNYHFAWDLQPLGSNTKDNWDWRFNLKVGDRLDCYDTVGTCFNCTVVGASEDVEKDIDGKEYKIKFVHIGFRIYDEEFGDADDEMGLYYGYKNYDENINIASPRLYPYKTMAKKFNK